MELVDRKGGQKELLLFIFNINISLLLSIGHLHQRGWNESFLPCWHILLKISMLEDQIMDLMHIKPAMTSSLQWQLDNVMTPSQPKLTEISLFSDHCFADHVIVSRHLLTSGGLLFLLCTIYEHSCSRSPFPHSLRSFVCFCVTLDKCGDDMR